MNQHPDNAAQDLEALPGGREARWSVSVDELADNTNWLLEIDSPELYLTFEVADLSVLDKAIALLNSTLNGQSAAGKREFVAKTDDVALGHFSRASVHLLRDNEDFPRCFVVVGPGSRSTLRISLYEDGIRAFANALAQAMRDYTGEMGNGNRQEALATFVGGPLDQVRLDHNQINAVASVVPVFTEAGNRQFLLMPPPDECNRILRGEATKGQIQGTLYPYERQFLPGRGVVYRYSDRGQFEEAMQPQPPLSPEAQARKHSFAAFANQFIEQLKNTDLNEYADVFIVYLCVDKQGRDVTPYRVSITPTTKVRLPGDQEKAREFAVRTHLDTIIANINSVVRNAPTEFVTFPEQPELPVQIQSFKLEIEQPDTK
jgi:hypothetical protein